MDRKKQVLELFKRFGKDFESSLAGLSTEEQLLVTSVFKQVIPLFQKQAKGYYEAFYAIYEIEILEKLRSKARVLSNLRLTDYFDQGSFKLLELQTVSKIDSESSKEQFLSNAEYEQFMKFILKLINQKHQSVMLEEPKIGKQKVKVEKPDDVDEMEKHGDREEYLTIAECAKFLKCSEVTIHAYKKKGMPFLQSGRTVRFLKSEILAFMRKESRAKGKGQK